MSRWISLLLAAALLLGMGGCAAKKDPVEQPVNFYYVRLHPDYTAANGLLAAEVREGAGQDRDYALLLETYLRGPADGEWVNPFPEGLTLCSVSTEADVLSITVSEELAQLSGANLSIACACLALTGMDLTGCGTVRISADGQTLFGEPSVQLRKEDLVFEDDTAMQLRDNMTVYLRDRESSCLVGVRATVNLASGNGAYAMLLELLLQGDEEHPSPLPEGTRLLGVSVEDGLCAVNFSAEFENKIGTDTCRQRLALQSVANTLTQLSTVTGVHFYCEGTRLLHYGALDTREPWVESRIGVSDLEEADSYPAVLYVNCGTGSGLVGIPIRLPENDQQPAAQVVQALLDFHNHNGYLRTIPSGITLTRTSMEDGVCTVTLAGNLLNSRERMETAIRSVVASVCSLPEVEKVRVILDGQTLPGEYGNLFTAVSPQTEWFA